MWTLVVLYGTANIDVHNFFNFLIIFLILLFFSLLFFFCAYQGNWRPSPPTKALPTAGRAAKALGEAIVAFSIVGKGLRGLVSHG